ncbi:MAG: hypothetical protein ACREJM_01785, partial [Candidatus Saccharimonadales bacterium]
MGLAGNAVRGIVHSNTDLPSASLGLVIPKGVTVLDNFGSGSSLNLTGDLIDAGRFFAYSTNTGATNATLNANDITVQHGAILSSVLPGSLIPGLGVPVPNLSLTLNANEALLNAGTISSARDLNLVSGNIVNSGLITTIGGNVNISTVRPENIVFNNTNGIIKALNGSINFRDSSFTGANNLTLTGGDWLAQNLNLYSGQGSVTANVGNVSGVVNIYAGSARTFARSGNLDLGIQDILGDPTYYNIGNITLSNNINVGESLAILATGNIIGTSALTSIDTEDSTFVGHDITMVAGANLTPGCGSCTTDGTKNTSGSVTVDLTSLRGGDIDFSAS